MRKVWRLAAGWSLIVLGVIGGFVPILQGWIFIIAGLAILAKDYKWAADLKHKASEKWREIRRRKGKSEDDGENGENFNG